MPKVNRSRVNQSFISAITHKVSIHAKKLEFSNHINASHYQLFEVWEVFCADHIKYSTKVAPWLKLRQKTHFLQKKLQQSVSVKKKRRVCPLSLTHSLVFSTPNGRKLQPVKSNLYIRNCQEPYRKFVWIRSNHRNHLTIYFVPNT